VYALDPLVGEKNGPNVGKKLSIVAKDVGEIKGSTINGSHIYLP
tara:strand:+ start:136 stop:267 length:132 start_codon:yes stop_codon:yes gene_type:complete